MHHRFSEKWQRAFRDTISTWPDARAIGAALGTGLAITVGLFVLNQQESAMNQLIETLILAFVLIVLVTVLLFLYNFARAPLRLDIIDLNKQLKELRQQLDKAAMNLAWERADRQSNLRIIEYQMNRLNGLIREKEAELAGLHELRNNELASNENYTRGLYQELEQCRTELKALQEGQEPPISPSG